MARPKNKIELQELSSSNYKKMMDQVDDINRKDKDLKFPNGYLNQNIKDVLAHLHEWHNMMLIWYQEGMNGLKPEMPKKGYSWKMTKDLNQEIRNTYKDDSYADILSKLKASHLKVSNLIDSHSDEELFTKKRYPWTGSTSVGAYLISSTSSHYDWAFKLIKKCAK
jgi:hypothetical protein